jgi:hypothetical protein
MVGHEQHRPVARRLAVHPQRDARAMQQAQRPGLHTGLLLLGLHARKAQQHDQQPMQRVDQQAQHPP